MGQLVDRSREHVQRWGKFIVITLFSLHRIFVSCCINLPILISVVTPDVSLLFVNKVALSNKPCERNRIVGLKFMASL